MIPTANKFHRGNGEDQKHYWLTPLEIYVPINRYFKFDFDACPYPLPEGFDGLTCDYGKRTWVNPPFGSIMHQGRKKGPTFWMRKGFEEQSKGNLVVLVYPIDKWVLMNIGACGNYDTKPLYDAKNGFNEKKMIELLDAGHNILNLGDVRWCATEDGTPGKGTGRHIAMFVFRPTGPRTT